MVELVMVSYCVEGRFLKNYHWHGDGRGIFVYLYAGSSHFCFRPSKVIDP